MWNIVVAVIMFVSYLYKREQLSESFPVWFEPAYLFVMGANCVAGLYEMLS